MSALLEIQKQIDELSAMLLVTHLSVHAIVNWLPTDKQKELCEALPKILDEICAGDEGAKRVRPQALEIIDAMFAQAEAQEEPS